MDPKTTLLANQLSDKIDGKIIDVDGSTIQTLIEQIREEAFAEARTIIKEIFLQTILAGVLHEMERSPTITALPDQNAVPTNKSPALIVGKPAVSADQVRQEIEAIRQKIATNEQRLYQGTTQPHPAPKTEIQEPVVDKIGGEDAGQGNNVGWGCYIYGIVRSSDHPSVNTLPEAGIDPNYPVYTISCQTLEAVVSRVSLQEFAQDNLEDKFNDRPWLEAKVMAHQDTLLAVMAERTLIPMRFCTIYHSELRVQTMLAECNASFLSTLEYLENKQEWAVKIYCDPRKLFEAAEKTNSKVQEIKTAISGKSQGAAYFMQKSLEETTSQEAERIRDDFAQLSYDRLARHALNTVLSDLQDQEITGREDVMVCNAAYLVPIEALEPFRTELEALEQEYHPLGVTCELTGPWPPYNFVTLNFEEHSV